MVVKKGDKIQQCQPGVYRSRTDMDKTGWESFVNFLWNPKEKSCMGRDAFSWFRVLGFYVIFYSGMCAFLYLHVYILLNYILDYNVPYFQLNDSRIGSNPGLAFVPVPIQDDVDIYIRYELQDPTTIDVWTEKLDEFLNKYKEDKNEHVKCDFNKFPAGNETCSVDYVNVGPCTAENNYGWKKGVPCIFLKLNKIYKWRPQFHNDVTNLPKDMPENLVKYIKALPAANRDQIWVACHNKKPVENNVTFEYYPSPGLPSFYYPYVNTPNYISPFVAVPIYNLTKETRYTIECRVWAKNVIYYGHRNERQGSIIFDIMVS